MTGFEVRISLASDTWCSDFPYQVMIIPGGLWNKHAIWLQVLCEENGPQVVSSRARDRLN